MRSADSRSKTPLNEPVEVVVADGTLNDERVTMRNNLYWWDGERLGHSEPVVVDKSMPWMGPFAWTAYLLTVQRFHPAIGRRPLST